MEIKICEVFYNETLAGYLMKTPSGKYAFVYSELYLASSTPKPISLSLPLQKNFFISDRLFSFFEGLLSEGWLKRVQSINQKIDEKDTFRLLEENGNDLIGAVKIIPLMEQK